MIVRESAADLMEEEICFLYKFFTVGFPTPYLQPGTKYHTLSQDEQMYEQIFLNFLKQVYFKQFEIRKLLSAGSAGTAYYVIVYMSLPIL